MYCAIIIFVEPIKSKATVRELCLYALTTVNLFPPFKTKTGLKEFLKQSHLQIINCLLHWLLQPMEKWFLNQQSASHNLTNQLGGHFRDEGREAPILREKLQEN